VQKFRKLNLNGQGWQERGGSLSIPEEQKNCRTPGLGIIFNNQPEAYSLFQGLRLATEKNISWLIVVGDHYSYQGYD